MLARCSHNLVNRLLTEPWAFVNACAGDRFRETAAWPTTGISVLLLPQHYLSGNEIGDHEDRKHEHVEPKIRKAESFGEGADADRLKPGRWKTEADRPSRTG